MLKSVSGQLGVLADKANNARDALGSIGRNVAVGIAGFFAVAVHSAIGYQEALTGVQVNAHLSEEAALELGKAINSTALGTRASGEDMLKALAPVAGELTRVTGAALTAADASNVLAASENLVTSSGGELRSSTKAITDLLLVYHAKTSDAAGITDTLFQAHSLLGIGTDRLAMMLQRLQPRISGSGVDMKHLLGIVLEMTPAVGSGTRAMMMVGNILQTLVSPSAAAQKALSTLGITLTDSSGKFIGFEAAVDRIKSAYLKLPASASASAAGMRLASDQAKLSQLQTEKQTKAIKAQEEALKSDIAALELHGADLDQNTLLQALFGRNANIAATLIKGGSKAIEEATGALTAQGTAAEAAAIKNKDLGAMLEIVKVSIGDAVTAIGGALVPAISSIFNAIMPLITAIVRWVEENPGLIAGIMAVVGAIAALVAGGLILEPLMRSIGLVMSFIGSPILVVVGAFFLLQAVLGSMPEVIKPLQPLFDALSDAVHLVGPALQALFGALADFMAGRGSIEAIGRALGDLGSALGAALAGVIGALGEVAARILDWAGSMIPIWAAAIARWAIAFVAWVAPMIPQFLAALGRFAADALAWIGNQVPQIAKQLLDWVGAFVGWIAPMASQALAALATWLGNTLSWVAGQLPEIATAVLSWIGETAQSLGRDLEDWARQFTDWLVPVASQLLVDLGNMANSVEAWIGQAAPILAERLAAWASAFADWAIKAIPALLDRLNEIIDRVTGWITSTTTIKDIASALVDWVAPFVTWASLAAVGAIAALVGFLAKEIVEKGPQIAGAVIGAGVQVVTGLAEGVARHPEMIAAAIGLLLTAGVVTTAIEAAAGAAGAIYATAANIGGAVADAVSVAWSDLQTAAISFAGEIAGLIYSGALRLAETLADAIQEAWYTLAKSPAVEAAITVAANVAGATYAAVERMVMWIAGGLKTAWLRMLGRADVLAGAAAAGAEAGAAYGAAEAAAAAAVSRVPIAVGPAGEKVVLSGIEGGLIAEGGQLANSPGIKAIGGKIIGAIVAGLAVGGGAIAGALLTTVGEAAALVGIGIPAAIAGLPVLVVAAIVGAIVLAITNPRWVGRIVGAIVGLIADAIKLAVGAIVGLHALADEIGHAIDNLIKDALGAIGEWIGAALGGVGEFIGNLLSGQWGDVYNSLSELGAGILTFFQNLGPNIGHAIGDGWDAVTTGIHDFLFGPDGWVGQLTQGMGEGYGAVDLQVGAGMASISGTITTHWGKIADDNRTGAATAAAAGVEAMTGAAGNMGKAADDMFNPAVAAATKAHDDIVAEMRKTPGDIANVLTNQQSQIDGAVTAFIGGFTTAFVEATPALQAAIAVVHSDLATMTDLDSREAYLKAQLVIAQYQLGAAQQSEDPVAMAAASGAIAKIRKQMADLQGAAEAYGRNTMDAYQQGLAKAPTTGVVSVLNSVANKLKAFSPPGPESPLHDIEIWGANTMAAYIDGIRSQTGAAGAATVAMMNRMVIAVLSGMATVRAVFVGAASALTVSAYSWGYNLAANYAHGIRAAMPLITSAVTAVATKVASNLRVSSPAKEGPLSEGGGPEGWGGRFDQLFAQGLINGQVALAARAVANSVGTPFSNGTPSLIAAGLVPGGGSTFGTAVSEAARGDTHVHIYLDGQEVKGFISRVLFEEERAHAGPAIAGSPF